MRVLFKTLIGCSLIDKGTILARNENEVLNMAVTQKAKIIVNHYKASISDIPIVNLFIKKYF